MTLPALVQWGIVAVVVGGGILAERHIAGTRVLVAVPDWVRMVLGGLALGGPWLLHSAGLLENAVLDDTVLALALSAALWLAATKVVGVGMGGESPATC